MLGGSSLAAKRGKGKMVSELFSLQICVSLINHCIPGITLTEASKTCR